MPYNKNNKTSVQDIKQTPYTRPPRTRKFEPCNYQACKGKLVDPRTKAAHAKQTIIPQRETITNFHEALKIPFIDPDPKNEINYNEEPQEEIYTFLVKRVQPIASQKNRMSKTSLQEVISELFSDDDDDDDTSEKHNGRYFEDNTLEYSSDDSEEDYQVNFDAPEIETEKINTRCTKKLDNTFSWIVIWILKFQQRFRLSNVAVNTLFQFLRYVLVDIDETKFSAFPTSLYMAQKDLGICVHLVKYAACEKCCKLYKIDDVTSTNPAIVPKSQIAYSKIFPTIQ